MLIKPYRVKLELYADNILSTDVTYFSTDLNVYPILIFLLKDNHPFYFSKNTTKAYATYKRSDGIVDRVPLDIVDHTIGELKLDVAPDIVSRASAVYISVELETVKEKLTWQTFKITVVDSYNNLDRPPANYSNWTTSIDSQIIDINARLSMLESPRAESENNSVIGRYRGFYTSIDEIKNIRFPKFGDFADCGIPVLPCTTANRWRFSNVTSEWEDTFIPVQSPYLSNYTVPVPSVVVDNDDSDIYYSCYDDTSILKNADIDTIVNHYLCNGTFTLKPFLNNTCTSVNPLEITLIDYDKNGYADLCDIPAIECPICTDPNINNIQDSYSDFDFSNLDDIDTSNPVEGDGKEDIEYIDDYLDDTTIDYSNNTQKQEIPSEPIYIQPVIKPLVNITNYNSIDDRPVNKNCRVCKGIRFLYRQNNHLLKVDYYYNPQDPYDCVINFTKLLTDRDLNSSHYKTEILHSLDFVDEPYNFKESIYVDDNEIIIPEITDDNKNVDSILITNGNTKRAYTLNEDYSVIFLEDGLHILFADNILNKRINFYFKNARTYEVERTEISDKGIISVKKDGYKIISRLTPNEIGTVYKKEDGSRDAFLIKVDGDEDTISLDLSNRFIKELRSKNGIYTLISIVKKIHKRYRSEIRRLETLTSSLNDSIVQLTEKHDTDLQGALQSLSEMSEKVSKLEELLPPKDNTPEDNTNTEGYLPPTINNEEIEDVLE